MDFSFYKILDVSYFYSSWKSFFKINELCKDYTFEEIELISMMFYLPLFTQILVTKNSWISTKCE